MSSMVIWTVALLAVFVPAIVALPHQRAGLKVVLGNDDGWAEANVRQFFSDLVASGNNVILSAPLNNKSGTSSLDLPPTVPTSPGEYNSVPAGAPAIGYDSANPRINYVNSFPVTAVKYGMGNLSSTFFGGSTDWVLAGPNVGANLGVSTLASGTVGVVAEAAKQGLPAIAFSGLDNTRKSYTELTAGDSPHVYSELALKVFNASVASNAIPPGYFLNVNFGKPTAACPTADKYKFVFTKVTSLWFGTPCDNGQNSADESDVQKNDCYVTISPVDKNKLSPLPSHQATIYNALKTALPMTCFTGSSTIFGDIGPIVSAIVEHL